MKQTKISEDKKIISRRCVRVIARKIKSAHIGETLYSITVEYMAIPREDDYVITLKK